MPTERLALALFMLAGLCGGGAEVWAQDSPGAAVPSLRDVVLDADGDGRPDRLGDTLSVAGRATVGTGELHDARLQIFIEDGTGGLSLFSPRLGASIARGDSVTAVGVLDLYQGLPQLRVLRYHVAGAPPRLPVPVEADFVARPPEYYAGRLVRFTGRLIDVQTNRSGRLLLINQPGRSEAILPVFVHNNQLARFEPEGFFLGDEITVTGLLARFDRETAVLDYQLLPRSADDFRFATRLPLSNHHLTLLSIVLGVVLSLLALVWVLLLRVQVRRRTRALAESERRMRRFSEATSEGIVLHEDGRILDVNQSVLHMTGYAYDEVIGRRIEALGPAESEAIVRQRLESGSEEPYELPVRRKDGSLFSAEIEARNLSHDGHRLRIVAVRDVTERKRYESEILAAKHSAEEMVRLKTSLLNNMSHELRTPIASILGFAQLISSESEGVHREFAEHIRQSGQRLLDTIDSVLVIAQIESGHVRLKAETVDVREVAAESVELLGPLARQKSVVLTLEGAEEAWLQTDRVALYRILNNLIGNAIKYTFEGRVVIRLSTHDDGVRIAVRDTGIGIDSAFLPHLFDAFKQESVGLARSFDGAGLGLAITKKLVELLGGTIEVASEKEVGSTFTVDLPDVQAPWPTLPLVERTPAMA